MTSTDIFSSKINCCFLKGLFALVNILVVQLGLNLINSLTALYPSQNTWFQRKANSGNNLHTSSHMIIFSHLFLGPISLHFTMLQPCGSQICQAVQFSLWNPMIPISLHLQCSCVREDSVKCRQKSSNIAGYPRRINSGGKNTDIKAKLNLYTIASFDSYKPDMQREHFMAYHYI